MNCDTCAYRVALPGFADKVGRPQTPHYHPDDAGPRLRVDTHAAAHDATRHHAADSDHDHPQAPHEVLS